MGCGPGLKIFYSYSGDSKVQPRLWTTALEDYGLIGKIKNNRNKLPIYWVHTWAKKQAKHFMCIISFNTQQPYGGKKGYITNFYFVNKDIKDYKD